jgi:adenosylhomocysteine nucleosidase
LVSFGLAGGLDPARPPGTLVLADRVLGTGGRSLPTDGAWRQRMLVALGAPAGAFPFEIASGALLGSDGLIAEPSAKAQRFAATGALAVDMESHGVAEAAHAAGLPFLVVRAIADPAGLALPSSVRQSLHPDGGLRILSILGRLALRPGEWRAVAALAGHSRKALFSLRQAGRPMAGSAPT